MVGCEITSYGEWFMKTGIFIFSEYVLFLARTLISINYDSFFVKSGSEGNYGKVNTIL